jgi:hypothetical protein
MRTVEVELRRPLLTRNTSFFLCRKKRLDAAHDKKSRDAAGRRLARASMARLLAVRNPGENRGRM